MSRNPSAQFVHKLNWYVPAPETARHYAVYWGRLVHRRMIRIMLTLSALTVLLAVATITFAVLCGRAWYAGFSAFYVIGIIFTSGSVMWGVRLAHRLGRDQAERDHRMYQQTLSMDPEIVKESPLAKFVPIRVP